MTTVKEQREKESLRREKTAGFFLDMAKVTFAGMVIGSMVSVTANVDSLILILAKSVIGALLTFVFARVGFKILKDK